jgi:transposase
MLSRGEDVEVDALVKRGWNISAIARHLGRDRGTISNYVNGRTEPGVRHPAGPDPLKRFTAYVSARFADDPHLWATALYDEVVAMGYDRSYPSFARQLRLGALRPHCEACTGVKGRETVEIDHPAGEEIQWDWFERRHAPWGATAYVLLGTLSHSGRTRGVLAEAMDQPHLIEAMDAVMRRLGGTTRIWRTDRLATVIVPGTADVQASFAPVAKHYAAIVAPCPPRRGNRKGAVECGVKYVCGRWWRTMTATTPTDAQVSLDRFLATAGDGRLRPPGRYVDPDELADGQRPAWPTVGALADAEVLTALPAAPYPATIEVSRPVDDRASVAFRGNRYSVAPGLGGVEVVLRHRVGTGSLEGRWATTMRFYAGPRLLIIDEVGYLPLPAEAAAALFQVVTQRYLKGSIALTTNLGIASWGKVFNDDPMVAAAMLDRLLHRSVVINIDGDSYRMRSHRARAEATRRAR